MEKLSMATAIRRAIYYEMKRDSRIFVMGQDMTEQGGSNKVLKDLYKLMSEDRIIDTPVSENQLLGMAVGSALVGLVPVIELLFSDFIGCAGDFIINQMPKFRYMFGGQTTMPITLRLTCGAGFQMAAQHSQCLEAFFVHLPGLKVVYPSNATDAMVLMLSSIRDENPVIFLEHRKLYNTAAEITSPCEIIPLGVGRIVKQGVDVTVVATGNCVHLASEAARNLPNVSIEIIDPRTLFPLDTEMLFTSVKKTGRVIIVTEETKRGAWSAELSAIIAEKAFHFLKSPIIRIGSLDTPIPFARNLEEYVLPSVSDIITAVNSLYEDGDLYE